MSVRSRLDAAARENEQAEGTLSSRSASTLVVRTSQTMSTRERAERNELVAREDSVVRNPEYRHGGMGHAVVVPGNVRDRLNRQADEKAEETAPSNSAVDYYYAIYKEQQAKEEAAEAQRRANGDVAEAVVMLDTAPLARRFKRTNDFR